MVGIEIAHCTAAIDAVLAAYYDFLEATVDEAVRLVPSYGKSDTLGLDAIPEITIVEVLEAYDPHAVIITEERGGGERFRMFTREDDPRTFRTFYLSDPMDRSIQFAEFLRGVDQKGEKLGAVLRRPEARARWEREYGAPAAITGASSAVTGVRRGVPIFSVMVNYCTQQLFVACSAGVYVVDLPDTLPDVDLGYVRAQGTPVLFRAVGRNRHTEMRRFVTYLGKRGYKENFLDSGLMSEQEMAQHLHYGLPGGPLRIFYLSTLQPEGVPIGFIVSNGEKIGEWIHWLSFLRFARMSEGQREAALQTFEIYQDRPWTKDGILMATSPPYSVFREVRESGGKVVIDVRRFSDFENPSKLRSTLLVTPRGNQWAARVVKQHGYRPIVFSGD